MLSPYPALSSAMSWNGSVSCKDKPWLACTLVISCHPLSSLGKNLFFHARDKPSVHLFLMCIGSVLQSSQLLQSCAEDLSEGASVLHPCVPFLFLEIETDLSIEQCPVERFFIFFKERDVGRGRVPIRRWMFDHTWQIRHHQGNALWYVVRMLCWSQSFLFFFLLFFFIFFDIIFVFVYTRARYVLGEFLPCC